MRTWWQRVSGGCCTWRDGFLRRNRKASSKGQCFQPPLGPHKHWHVDISYVNLAGSVLDSYSRYLVPGELRESMKEVDVEIILERSWEKFPRRGRGSSPTTGTGAPSKRRP